MTTEALKDTRMLSRRRLLAYGVNSLTLNALAPKKNQYAEIVIDLFGTKPDQTVRLEKANNEQAPHSLDTLSPEETEEPQKYIFGAVGDDGIDPESNPQVAEVFITMDKREVTDKILCGDLDYSIRGHVDVLEPFIRKNLDNGSLVAVPSDWDIKESKDNPKGRKKERNFQEYYGLKEKGYNYVYKKGPVALITVNTAKDDKYSLLLQRAWVLDTVRRLRADSSISWIGLVGSRPGKSSGLHGMYPEIAWNELIAGGLDFKLHADNHSYERLAEGIGGEPIPESTTGQVETSQILLTVINGCGGQVLKQNRPDPLPITRKRYDGSNGGTFGCTIITATKEQITFEYVTIDNATRDKATLRRINPNNPLDRRTLLIEEKIN